METERARVLVIGYGNPGRRDDGLGPAFAEALAAKRIPGVAVDSDYQLTVEDAHALSGVQTVLFADADASGPAPFAVRRVAPRPANAVGTHGVEPGEVLELAQSLFGARCDAFVLGIRGYEFDLFAEGLSERARANLEAALCALDPVLRGGDTFETLIASGAATASDTASKEQR
jgi:hydrogenase maturation protease